MYFNQKIDRMNKTHYHKFSSQPLYENDSNSDNCLNINYDQVLFSLGGEYLQENSSPTNTFFFYSPIDSFFDSNHILLWKKTNLPSFKYKRSCTSIILFEHFVYIIGGYDGQRAMDTVERYDFIAKQWTMAPAMIHRRSSCSSVLTYHKNRPLIYTFGGVQGNQILSPHNVYDIQENQCYLEGELRIPRSSCKACLLENHKVYVIGGITETDEYNSDLPIEIYDLITKEAIFSQVNYNYYSFAALQVNSRTIYLAGGCDSSTKKVSTDFFRYDPISDELIQLQSLLYKRMHANLVLYQDKIICIGGYDGDKLISKAEYYDYVQNRWEEFEFLFHPYSGSSTFSYRATSKIEGKTDINGKFQGFVKSETYLERTNSPFPFQKENSLILITSNGLFKDNERNDRFHMSLYWNGEDIKEKHFDQLYYTNNENVSFRRKEFERKMKVLEDNNITISNDYLCPITKELMYNPCVIDSGHTYEMTAIRNWLKFKKRDPLTNAIVKKEDFLFPNILIKKQISSFLEEAFLSLKSGIK